ncbi:Crp/Fnr family transcriptional regulator [Sphingomonas sp. PB4P5]|uniref:Crp/Fnr family transcriptional regulator n=1 Tax=Parasphingomonas puruogangriensis TaxID=3096155 RepID=UPI002FCB40C9
MPISCHPALLTFLDRLLLRSALSEKEQQAVLKLPSKEQSFKARRDVVLPGDAVNTICIVASGVVGRFEQTRDGSRQTTAFYILGDACDLHSLVAPIAGSGITALSDCVILRISHEDLWAATDRYPNLAIALWRDTIVDASILAQWVVNVGRRDAQARVAHLFCEMGMRAEHAGLGLRERYDLPVTQVRIAESLGLTPVHVNRMLQGLRDAGAVSMKNSVVEVHDWKLLASIADFVPTFLLYPEPTYAPKLRHSA